MPDMGHGVGGRDTPPARLEPEDAASVAATLQALATPSRLLILTRLRSIVYRLYDNHVAMLLDEAVYHIEHLRLGVRDESAG